MKIFLYGPSGSGKSTLGRRLAEGLALPFVDLDEKIEGQAGQSIPEIFRREGESGFRQWEKRTLGAILDGPDCILSLGGGALLDQDNRRQVEAAGAVLCLSASQATLVKRLAQSRVERPLLQPVQGKSGDRIAAVRQNLEKLLAERETHYQSFRLQLNTDSTEVSELVFAAQTLAGAFRVTGMGGAYDVRVVQRGLGGIGAEISGRGLSGPVMIVSDENVANRYGEQVLKSLEDSGFEGSLFKIQPGEQFKTLASVQAMWQAFLESGIERSSTILALGGGVVGDLAGFAAATYLRGVRWVVAPTTLLAMVDSSLGGKTGADLPQGKNLIGAFYPPQLVFADPEVLDTLPVGELRSGMAEVVKAGLIGDAGLFELCSAGWETVNARRDEIVKRAMAVKIQVIQDDPYEKGRRASLNLGHTVGHAVEHASDYRLRHGEAVAIGMVVEACLAEKLGLADPGLAQAIRDCLESLGLPVDIPAELEPGRILEAMQVDKKRRGGQVRFALPVHIGQVKTGVVIDDLEEIFSCVRPTSNTIDHH
jgi:shikimate kinase/3-dehydroquinate synthase